MCHFVLVFFSPFSIVITSLGEERANLSAFHTFVRFVLLDLSVFSSSWGLGRAAVCDCGTPWTCLLPFFQKGSISMISYKCPSLPTLPTLLTRGSSLIPVLRDSEMMAVLCDNATKFNACWLFNDVKYCGHSARYLPQCICTLLNFVKMPLAPQASKIQPAHKKWLFKLRYLLQQLAERWYTHRNTVYR